MKLRKEFRLLLSITLIIVFALSACSQVQETVQEEDVVSPETEGFEPARVAFLTITPFSPFAGDVWNGILRAEEDGYASEVKKIEFSEPGEYLPGVRAASEDGYDVIIVTYGMFIPVLEEVAPNFPDTKYVIINTAAPEPEEDFSNVRGYIYKTEEGSYVNGVMAAMMCGDHIGFVGGDDGADILRFLAGFEKGIADTNPDAELTVAFAGTFSDPVKGREVALSVFQRGANCIMQAANQTGLGVINAGQELSKPIFGVDIDQSDLAPDVIIASALANNGESAYRSIVDTVMGRWTGGTIFFGVDQGVSAVAINYDFPPGIPEEVLAAATEAQEKIARGEIEIPVTTDTR